MGEVHKTLDPDGYCGSDLHPAFLQGEKVGGPTTLGEAMGTGVQDITRTSVSIHPSQNKPQNTRTLSDKLKTILDRVLGPVGLHKEVATEADSGDLSHIGFFIRWRMNVGNK